MITADDIKNLVKHGENRHLEMKRCSDKLPKDIWETYSAFANTRGGIILLGVTEHKDRKSDNRFEFTGVSDINKVITDFLNMVNNRQKVSRSITVDSDIKPVEVDGVDIIYIRVPEADYRQKPIYIDGNLQSGTYKRVFEGDRHVTDEELSMLIRDSSDHADSTILDRLGMECIDADTLRKYRQAFIGHNPVHVFESMSDQEFLENMGGYAKDIKQEIEGLTAAGLLMFGKSIPIHRNYPNFRFDYLDLIGIEPGSSKKWNDRLTDDGRWVDNIYNFLSIGLNKLLFTLPSEGRLKGVVRIDGGDLYEGVREGFINALTYCDYRLGGVLRIDRRSDRIVMRNPGTLRIAPERIYNGDYTQARNCTIQKMLRMVGFSDNIGSGFRKIMAAWKSIGYLPPDIYEEEEVNEVWLTLPLLKDTENAPKGIENVLKGTENVSRGTEVENIVAEPTSDVLSMPLPNEVASLLTDIQKSIAEAVLTKPTITLSELAKTLNLSIKSIRVQREKLKGVGVIMNHSGAQKSGEWRLTYQSKDTIHPND